VARDERGIIQQIFADTGDVAEPTFDFAEGWPVAYAQAGGQTPEREVFNRLFQRLYALGYDATRFGGGLPWDATIDYAVPAVVTDSDGLLYVALAESGPDVGGGGAKKPADNPTYWASVGNNSEVPLSIVDGIVDWDLKTAPVATVTLTGDATLAAPSNMRAGGRYRLRVKQDATGEHGLDFAAAYIPARLAGDIPAMGSTAGAYRVYEFVSTGAEMVCLTESAQSATNYVGDIRLWPFAGASLPEGWYLTNGDTYADASDQGIVLHGLSAAYQAAWGIESSGGYINVPDLFDSNGNGYFPRPVDGTARQVGNIQGDAIRNITGEASHAGSAFGQLQRFDVPAETSGALTAGQDTPYALAGATSDSGSRLRIDVSLVVPTAEENRPVNIGMTPAIYLGV
jgi:hypothetical protein